MLSIVRALLLLRGSGSHRLHRNQKRGEDDVPGRALSRNPVPSPLTQLPGSCNWGADHDLPSWHHASIQWDPAPTRAQLSSCAHGPH